MVLVWVGVQADLDLLSLSFHLNVCPEQLRALLAWPGRRMVATRRSARLQETQAAAEGHRAKRRDRQPLPEAENEMPEPLQQPECNISAREVAAAQAARQRLYGKNAAAARPSGRLPDGPAPAIVEVDYTPAESLLPCSSPENDGKNALQQMQSSDWTEACSGLTLLRRLARHHHAHCRHLLGEALPLVLKSVKNLRSSVCKLAIMCVSDLVLGLGNDVLPLLDVGGAELPATSLLNQLLLKASSNDKRFVVEEAMRALDTLSQQVSPVGLAERVLPYTSSRSPKQRGAAAGVLLACVQRMTHVQLAVHACQPFLQAAGALVTDNTQEARDASRHVIALVHTAFAANMDSAPASADIDNTTAAIDAAPVNHFTVSPTKGSLPALAQVKCNLQSATHDAERGAGEIQALRLSQGKENCQEHSPGEKGGPQEAWAAYCRRSLAPTVAAAVLKVTN